ncbi:MAG TPA: tol-pal system protein YbgF [Caldimonas sp.]|nr:tol-pal system protein YbgF [Caldimonas sp.]
MRRIAGSAKGALAAALIALVAGAYAPPARAGIFDDDEARRAILDLRKQLEQSNEQARARQAEQMTTMSAQLDQLKRSLLDLNTRIDQQRDDNAKLRGQIEQLTRDVAELQRKQTDVQQGIDERLRKVEPQKVTIDDREFSVDPEEKRQYDDALGSFRKGEFDRATVGFAGLLKRFPGTGYRDSALFWLGNAQYGLRAYKEAIASFRNLVTASPDSPRAPEALLAIANCQAELKDTKAARRTIDELLKSYPKSEAAQAGRERLASLK